MDAYVWRRQCGVNVGSRTAKIASVETHETIIEGEKTHTLGPEKAETLTLLPGQQTEVDFGLYNNPGVESGGAADILSGKSVLQVSVHILYSSDDLLGFQNRFHYEGKYQYQPLNARFRQLSSVAD